MPADNVTSVRKWARRIAACILGALALVAIVIFASLIT